MKTSTVLGAGAVALGLTALARKKAGPSVPPTQEVEDLHVQLIQLWAALINRITATSWWDSETKAQLQTAANTLNNTINGPFARLKTAAKAGDPDALRRIRHVASTALEGMSDILHELDTATAENLKQLAKDIDADLRKVTGKVASAAASGAGTMAWESLKNAPFITVGAGVLVAAWAYGRFKK
jgi:hypothetical protein